MNGSPGGASAAREMLAGAPCAALLVDERGRLLDANEAARRLLGAEAVAGSRTLLDLVSLRDRSRHGRALDRLLGGDAGRLVGQEIAVVLRDAAGRPRTADLVVVAGEEAGQHVAWVVEPPADPAVAAKFVALVDALRAVPDAVVLAIDERGVLTAVAGGAATVLGVSPDDVGRPADEALAAVPAAAAACARGVAGATASAVVERASAVLELTVRGQAGGGCVALGRDVTAARAARSRIDQAAERDRVTGLLDRPALERALEPALAGAGLARAVGVVHVAVQDFSVVNAAFGRSTADRVLGELAERLRRALPSAAAIGRTGGVELAVVLKDLPGNGRAALADAERTAVAALEAPLEVKELTIRPRVASGTAMAPRDGATAESLLRRADARAAAVRRESADLAIDLADAPAARDWLELAAELHGAVGRRELQLCYQPIFWLADGRPYGAEALIRWNHPDRGLLEAREFVPIAARTGALDPIGDWVVAELCEQMAVWRARGVFPQAHFNVAPSQLRKPDFGARLLAAVESRGLPAGSLTIEVPHAGGSLAHPRVATTLEELHTAGLQIAIDNVGTGTLADLRAVPVDVIKLDRALLRDVPARPAANAIVEAVLEIASALGAQAVAQGIEMTGQRAFLVERRCSLGQGFKLGRPASALPR